MRILGRCFGLRRDSDSMLRAAQTHQYFFPRDKSSSRPSRKHDHLSSRAKQHNDNTYSPAASMETIIEYEDKHHADQSNQTQSRIEHEVFVFIHWCSLPLSSFSALNIMFELAPNSAGYACRSAYYILHQNTNRLHLSICHLRSAHMLAGVCTGC